MRSSRRALVLTSAALVALLLSPAGSPGAAPAVPPRVVTGSVNEDPAAARRFWTPARMRSARPVRMARRVRELGRLPSDVRGRPGGVEATYSTETRSHSEPLDAQRKRSIPYTRSEITDPSVAPYRQHGKIFFRLQGDPPSVLRACSGTALTSVNMSVVWTAAHCVFNTDPAVGGVGFATDWIFVPGYRNGSAPYGVWPGTFSAVPTGWVVDRSLSFDFAAVVVAANQKGQRLVELVGGRGFTWNQPRQQQFDAFGYPAGSPFDGGKLYVCASSYGGDNDPPGPGPNAMAMGCDMTQGASGGGWVINGSQVNSNVSYGAPETMAGVFFGPYLGDDAAAIYNLASQTVVPSAVPSPGPIASPSPSPPPSSPVTHPTAVTLRLRSHLVARGRLIALDGYAACTRGAPVGIYRKTASGWKLLRSKTTGPEGGFRFTLRDRPGRYRATTSAGSVDTVNLCSKATSVTRRHSH